MTASANPLDLGPAAAELLAPLGAPVREAAIISPLRSPAARRLCYRVELDDGRTVKLRRLVSEARAACYARLVAELAEPRLARVLGRRADVTLEEWVPGRALDGLDGRDEHRAAGATLLGSLHSRAALAGRPLGATVSTRPTLEAIRTDLAALVDGGALERSLAARLAAAAERADPGAARAGVLHTDLCPENLVVDGGGVLRAIDNEAMRIGPTAFDLARVWYRWPMTEAEWRDYLAAYGRFVDPEPALAHFAFWQTAAVARSARIRVSRGAPATGAPLLRLASLAGSPAPG